MLVRKRQHEAPGSVNDDYSSVSEYLAALSATANQVPEKTLQHMFITLQRDMQKNISPAISNLQTQIDQLGDCTDQVEWQLSDFTMAYNKLVDAYQSYNDNLQYIMDTFADLEHSWQS